MAKRKDFSHLFGTTAELLTVTGVTYRPSRRWPIVMLTATCRCGTSVEIPPDRLGKTRSCGCITSELITKSKITHGASRRYRWTPEYRTWAGMIVRCENPNVARYDRYGGRGIRVCERWRSSFEAFLEDMGFRPSPSMSIDRFPDNDGNYEPGNCRWATKKEQARGRRRFIEAFGERLSLGEWAAKLGVKPNVIVSRLHIGWSAERAVSEPLRLPKSK